MKNLTHTISKVEYRFGCGYSVNTRTGCGCGEGLARSGKVKKDLLSDVFRKLGLVRATTRNITSVL